MNVRIAVLILCLLCAGAECRGQGRRGRAEPAVRTVSLRNVGRYANRYTPGTLKLSRVVLAGFKHIEDDWVHVFHLRDPRTGLQRGEDLTIHTHSFLICTDERVGKPLLAARDEWVGRKVNVYLIIIDRALTPNIYVGYVTKVELLDDRGRVVKTIQE